MAGQQQLMPVPLAVIQPGTRAPVDLYIRDPRTLRHTLYKAADTPLDEDVRKRLLERGIEQLYLRTEDRAALYQYLEEHITGIIRDRLLPTEEAARIVYKSSTRVMEDVFSDPRAGRNIRRAQNMVEAIVSAILHEPNTLWQITSIASHDYYTYTHSVNVCVFLVGAARYCLGLEDESALQNIASGGIFHDIGKTLVPEDVLRKPEGLTEEEFSMIKQHPEKGLEILGPNIQVRPATAAVIRSHHERLDGSGYPDGLWGQEVEPVARLAGIVDTYDAMTTDRPYAAARQPYEALEFMLAAATDELDVDLLRSFIRFLGPREARAEGPSAAGARGR